MSARPLAPAPLRIVHTESSCGWGGQEIRILTESAGFIARGHDVRIVCPPDSQLFAAAPAYGVPTVALPIARKNLAGFAAVAGWLRREGRGIDVINTHSSTDTWLTAIASLVVRGAPPLVRTRHVSSPVSTKRSSFWLYQRAVRHVVTTGETLKAQLARDNGFDPATMTSVPTGIALDRYRPGDRVAARAGLGLPGERSLIGIVATLRNWKGHVFLFQAFAKLAPDFPAWDLVIVGDGPQRHNLERLAGELGLAERIRFVGNRDDVPVWLAAIDLFVLPSYGDEGVPQSVMQAMAAGLPVVSTPVGAIAEAVADGDTGILVPPRDADALAAALGRLMADPALRERFGRAGRARAELRFGVDVMIDAMEAVFRRAIAGAR